MEQPSILCTISKVFGLKYVQIEILWFSKKMGSRNAKTSLSVVPTLDDLYVGDTQFKILINIDQIPKAIIALHINFGYKARGIISIVEIQNKFITIQTRVARASVKCVSNLEQKLRPSYIQYLGLYHDVCCVP
jgi:hypothetical protein